jgi:hypothetical protein
MHLKECMRDPTGFTSLPRRGIDNTEEDTIGLSKLFARITMTSSPTACQWSPSNQAAARGKCRLRQLQPVPYRYLYSAASARLLLRFTFILRRPTTIACKTAGFTPLVMSARTSAR